MSKRTCNPGYVNVWVRTQRKTSSSPYVMCMKTFSNAQWRNWLGGEPLNVKTPPRLSDILVFSNCLVFSRLFFSRFSGCFRFSLASVEIHHIRIHYHHYRFSECWLVAPLSWQQTPFSYVLRPLTQTSSYATANVPTKPISLVKRHCGSVTGWWTSVDANVCAT